MRQSVGILRTAVLASLVAAGGVWPAMGQGPQQSQAGAPSSERPAQLQGVDYAQKLGEQVPADLPFVDETGRRVVLGDYFGPRPVVLVLAYYECPMLCTQVLSGLTAGLKGLRFDAGQQFEVVVVSIDPGEGPELAAQKKAQYVAHYDRPETAGAWHFLTGRKADIDRLAKTVGFSYTYDEKTDQYAHAAGLSILTPDGKIARYLFGIDFAPRDLRLGIVEATDRKIASPIDSVLLYCFHYDPAAGKYGLMAMKLVRTAGVLFVLTAFGGWLFLRRQERRGVYGGGPVGLPPGASTKA